MVSDWKFFLYIDIWCEKFEPFSTKNEEYEILHINNSHLLLGEGS